MSKILDKIKSFGNSLASMFKENEDDDISYLNPDTEEGKKIAEEMKPFVDRINDLEEKRSKEQREREDMIKSLRKGDVSGAEKSSKVQDTRKKATPIIKQGVQKGDENHTIQKQTFQGIDEREE